MKSAKFIACCFVEVPNDDIFCKYEFKDSAGTVHTIVGKRGDWLYKINNPLRRVFCWG